MNGARAQVMDLEAAFASKPAIPGKLRMPNAQWWVGGMPFRCTFCPCLLVDIPVVAVGSFVQKQDSPTQDTTRPLQELLKYSGEQLI